MMRRLPLAISSTAALCLFGAMAGEAQKPSLKAVAPPWFEIAADAIYETGDAWIVGRTRYQLYGVQSCLRGTSFTNAGGFTRDCGEASLAMFASLVRDLKPLCHPAAIRPDKKTTFVFCFATIADGPAKGSRIDIGTALIAIGWAYAALGPDGRPIHPLSLIHI